MMLEGKDKIAGQVESKTNWLELNRPQDAHLVPSMSFKMTYLSDKISTEMNLVKNDSEYASNSPHKLGSYRRYTYDVISDEEFEAKDQEDGKHLHNSKNYIFLFCLQYKYLEPDNIKLLICKVIWIRKIF